MSNDVEECKYLSEQLDVDILILDHHKIEQENPYAVVINCQDGKYPNNTLSGSGVVYKFIKEYDKKYKHNFANKYIDLCALGIISDQMDLRNYETRYLALQGLKNINNDFLKQIIEKNKVSENEEVNFKFIGWKIAPYVNAVARVGTNEEKRDLVDAFIGKEEMREYQPKKKSKNDPKPPIEMQTLQQTMVREIANVKGRQDRLVTKGMEELSKTITEDKLDEDKVIMVDATDKLGKPFTGLVANKLAEIYKRPIVVLRKMYKKKNHIYYGGSYRNYDLFPVESMMDLLKSTNNFEMIAGHPNAGGYKISDDRIQDTRDKLNETLKDVNIEDVYLVDYEIPVGRLKERHIQQVGEWEDVWGNTLRIPRFAITNIHLKISDIQLLGDKRNFIKIQKDIGNNRIIFIKKFASEEIYNKMIMKEKSKGLVKSKKTGNIKMDIIGEFTINKWNGSDYPQIEIIDFNVEKEKEFRF